MFAASKTASSGVAPDPQFNYVTMLLHGDGTNGAQNNTFVDSSSNNFTVTRNGNTTQGSFSPYGSNWSNYFNGSSGNYLTTTLTGQSFGTGNFTAEGWFYQTANVDYNTLMSQRTTNNSATGWIVGAGSSGNVYAYSNGFLIGPSGTAIKDKWNHIAFVRSSGTMTLYLNGVSVGTSTTSKTFSDTFAGIGGDGTDSNVLSGYASNVRYVVGTAVYTSAFTPPTAPLTAISGTSLLTCQSNRFIDNSTNAFTLTVNGTPSVQRFNPFGTSTAYTTSVIGGSGYFDGSGDYLSLASNAAFQFGTGDFTVEGWFYQTADNTYPSALELGPHISGNAILFITKYAGNATIYSNGFYGATTTTLNQWNHIAWVRSSGSLKIYVNGVSPAGVAFTNNLTDTSTGIAVGKSLSVGSAAYDYSGYMSNMRVVKGTAVYTANFTPPTTPLTAISGTSLLTNFTNGAIFDNAMMNDLETVGNAQISTSVVKYGTGSMYFDGTGDGLFTVSTPNLAFGTGDFTVEFWLYLAANLNTFAKVIQMGTSGNCFTIEAQGTANVLNVSNYTSTVYLTSNTALTTGTWIHVAVTRASGALRIFQNGASVGGVSNSIDFPNSGGIYIGRSSTGQETNGYIDDLRITKGYARYTTTFTPPTSAFSDTGPV